ncbi:hypothetical protein LJK87_01675 [Paenibacillus sp. P25]|nr:hypothetical protein LJK87_01675 [Paenibacillus sp. P25]
MTNTFRVRFLLGEFDPDERNPYAGMPDDTVCKPEHAALSLEAPANPSYCSRTSIRCFP